MAECQWSKAGEIHTLMRGRNVVNYSYPIGSKYAKNEGRRVGHVFTTATHGGITSSTPV